MKPSITNRIIVGKSIGFVIGGIAVLFIKMLDFSTNTEFMIGLWLFYLLLGAVIGLMGSLTHHPILKFRVPAGIRGSIMGVIMHLMLVLLAFDQVNQMLLEFDFFGMSCPYWALLDGIIIGGFIDLMATKYAGEGTISV